MNAQVTFQTTFFKPMPGEEEQTNVGRFGLALAEWLKVQLESRGVAVEQVVPEDFGWVLMVSRKPFKLWLGCGNTEGSTIEWSIFSVAELTFTQRILKKADNSAAVETLWRHVQAIVPQVPGVSSVTWEHDAQPSVAADAPQAARR